MRIILLLDPAFTFPHPLESFPMDRYFCQWLLQHPDNSLMVIGNCRLQLPMDDSESILFSEVSYDYRSPLLSSILYKWKVWRWIKKIRPDRIVFHNNAAFSFFAGTPWFSMLFRRWMKEDFWVLQHGFRKGSPAAMSGRIMNVPELPSPVFENPDEKNNDQVKEALTGGTEYFVCAASFTSPDQLTFLLKAYSIFKQRLKTGFKLVLTGLQAQDKRFFSLISYYKYRHDVVIPSGTVGYPFSSVLSAAYAHIFAVPDAYYPCTIADCAGSRVPVLYPEEKPKEQALSVGLPFAAGDVQDLAQKMMWIYKDEAGRKQHIEKMYGSFHPRQNSFDFSAYL